MVLMLINTMIAVVIYLIVGLGICYLISYIDFDAWLCKKNGEVPTSLMIVTLLWPIYIIAVCVSILWIYMEELVERIEKCAREQRRKRDGEKCL